MRPGRNLCSKSALAGGVGRLAVFERTRGSNMAAQRHVSAPVVVAEPSWALSHTRASSPLVAGLQTAPPHNEPCQNRSNEAASSQPELPSCKSTHTQPQPRVKGAIGAPFEPSKLQVLLASRQHGNCCVAGGQLQFLSHFARQPGTAVFSLTEKGQTASHLSRGRSTEGWVWLTRPRLRDNVQSKSDQRCC